MSVNIGINKIGNTITETKEIFSFFLHLLNTYIELDAMQMLMCDSSLKEKAPSRSLGFYNSGDPCNGCKCFYTYMLLPLSRILSLQLPTHLMDS